MTAESRGAVGAAKPPPVDATPNVPSLSPLGSGASLAMAAQLTVAGSSAILGVVIGRLLGPAGTGSFNLALSALLVLGAFSNAGIGIGVNYYVSRRSWNAGDALRQAQIAALALGAAGALAGTAVAASGIGGIFRGAPLTVFAVALAALPFWLSLSYSASVALALGRYGAYATAIAGQALSTLVLVAALAGAFGLVGAVVGLAAGQMLAALGLLAWGVRRLPATAGLHARESLAHLARAGKFGSTLYLAYALQFLNLRADLFILNAVAPLAVVGHYSVAISVMSLGLLLPAALATAVLPRVAALDAFGSDSERRIVSAKSVRHAVLALPVTAGLLAIALAAVPFLYGEDFTSTVRLGFILLPGTLGYGVATVMISSIVGRGRPVYVLYASALVTPPTLGLYLLLVPPFGGAGAALASTISYLATAAVLLWFFRRATGIDRLRELVPRGAEIEDYRALAARTAAGARSLRRGLRSLVGGS